MEEDSRHSVVARAPGRVNIIGGHTDYQEGYVLPFAVQLGVTIRARPRMHGNVVLRSDRMEEVAEFKVGEEFRGLEPAWARYPAAVVAMLGESGLPVPGFEGLLESDLPVGAGLASSAALTVASALTAIGCANAVGTKVPDFLLDGLILAGLCRDAEGLAVGVRCGIMDPYASLFGKKGMALLLDCRSRDHEEVPLHSLGAAFLVADSGVSRSLADGEYNRRRAECEAAVREIRANGVEIVTARDIRMEEAASLLLPLSGVHRRRMRHQVTERARTLSAKTAIESGDEGRLGSLMESSHRSLRDDYEVSCEELEALVAAAAASPGVVGSRLTGAGFGGAVIVAVLEHAVDEARDDIIAGYRARTGREARVCRVTPGDGAVLLGDPLPQP